MKEVLASSRYGRLSTDKKNRRNFRQRSRWPGLVSSLELSNYYFKAAPLYFPVRRIDQTIHRPNDRPTKCSTDWPTDRPTKRPTKEQTEQPTNQATTWTGAMFFLRSWDFL